MLGAGRMGSPIARHLLAGGRSVSVYDPSDNARRAVVEAGAAECASAGEVASRSDVVLVVVVDDEQVRDAVTASFGSTGTLVAICSSVRPETCRELAREGSERGVDVIDAALVRGERGAEEGQLVFYCGGPQASVDRLREAVAPVAEAVVRVGDVGAGQVAKTANNLLLWACLRADYEALSLGRALGVDPSALREALAIGSGANRPLAEWGKHRLRWPHKDLEVALGLAADADVHVPLVAALPELIGELSVDDLHELL